MTRMFGQDVADGYCYLCNGFTLMLALYYFSLLADQTQDTQKPHKDNEGYLFSHGRRPVAKQRHLVRNRPSPQLHVQATMDNINNAANPLNCFSSLGRRRINWVTRVGLQGHYLRNLKLS